jgi:trans-aconitate methyltransferase
VADVQTETDWQGWLRRWDAMQAGYLPEREERFAAMFDVIELLLPPSFVALDLGCGPGAIGQRLLVRFPQAQCIAVDNDPVLLTIGQRVLGDMDGRLRWIEADLRSPDWHRQLGEASVDAVLSTTALHWLESDDLVRLYRRMGGLVRPGGVVLDGDRFRRGAQWPTFQRVADAAQQCQEERASTQQGVENWRTWWAAVAQEPALQGQLAERERRGVQVQHGDEEAPILDVHLAALRDAGFREVGLIWQHLSSAILMAVR